MPHVHLLAAWQNQNLEKISEILYPGMIATFVLPDGTEKRFNYDEIIAVFKERFKQHQEWRFDVIYKTEREDDTIVVIRIFREDENYNLLEASSLAVMTFKTLDDKRYLIRTYIEMGITGTA